MLIIDQRIRLKKQVSQAASVVRQILKLVFPLKVVNSKIKATKSTLHALVFDVITGKTEPLSLKHDTK